MDLELIKYSCRDLNMVGLLILWNRPITSWIWKILSRAGYWSCKSWCGGISPTCRAANLPGNCVSQLFRGFYVCSFKILHNFSVYLDNYLNKNEEVMLTCTWQDFLWCNISSKGQHFTFWTCVQSSEREMKTENFLLLPFFSPLAVLYEDGYM